MYVIEIENVMLIHRRQRWPSTGSMARFCRDVVKAGRYSNTTDPDIVIGRDVDQ